VVIPVRNNSPVQLEITWGAREEELDDRDRLIPEQALGLGPADVQEMESLVPQAQLSVGSGVVGKGAAGPGVALYLQVAEHLLQDTAALIALAAGVRSVIARVSARRGDLPTIGDPSGLAVAAVASVTDQFRERLLETRYVGTFPITASAAVGTDRRDIWAVCFSAGEEGYGLVIFVSPAGTCLGAVSVPAETYFDGREWRDRSTDDLIAWWETESAPGWPGTHRR
jgi:hypothetical protein